MHLNPLKDPRKTFLHLACRLLRAHRTPFSSHRGYTTSPGEVQGSSWMCGVHSQTLPSSLGTVLQPWRGYWCHCRPQHPLWEKATLCHSDSEGFLINTFFFFFAQKYTKFYRIQTSGIMTEHQRQRMRSTLVSPSGALQALALTLAVRSPHNPDPLRLGRGQTRCQHVLPQEQPRWASLSSGLRAPAARASLGPGGMQATDGWTIAFRCWWRGWCWVNTGWWQCWEFLGCFWGVGAQLLF